MYGIRSHSRHSHLEYGVSLLTQHTSIQKFCREWKCIISIYHHYSGNFIISSIFLILLLYLGTYILSDAEITLCSCINIHIADIHTYTKSYFRAAMRLRRCCAVSCGFKYISLMRSLVAATMETTTTTMVEVVKSLE